MSSGGSAFPNPEFVEEMPRGSRVRHAQPGMTLRDYFAAKALAGMAANPHWEPTHGEAETAKAAYKLADAMLAAR